MCGSDMYSLLRDGYASHLLVSHDCAFRQRGRVTPDEELSTNPMHFPRNIAPRLQAPGIGGEMLDSILTDNPRCYFEGVAPVKSAAVAPGDFAES